MAATNAGGQRVVLSQGTHNPPHCPYRCAACRYWTVRRRCRQVMTAHWGRVHNWSSQVYILVFVGHPVGFRSFNLGCLHFCLFFCNCVSPFPSTFSFRLLFHIFQLVRLHFCSFSVSSALALFPACFISVVCFFWPSPSFGMFLYSSLRSSPPSPRRNEFH